MAHPKLKNLLISLVLGLIQAVATRESIPAQTFKECQKKTYSPLQGCPPGTIYVSQTDSRADFHTIQDAISSVGNDSIPHVILIAPGIYVEQLNVTRRAPLTLLGVSDQPSRGELYALNNTHNNKNNKNGPENENEVQVYWNSANHDAVFPDNVYTGVLTVGPNLNATLTGSGPTGFPVSDDTPFGCVDFRGYNIDFRNEYTPYSNGPAHAVGVSRANAGFYSCGFYSWQDTVYIGKLGNAYFHDTIVAGQTDFLYGFGTLFISASTLSLRNCGGGITAWKGTNTTNITTTTTLPSSSSSSSSSSSFENKYGVYISDSQLLASNNTIAPIIHQKCSLGRPWNDLHRSVFMDTYFDASILPAGYTPWAGKPDGNIGAHTTMAVYDVYGPGYDDAAERASNVTKVLDREQAGPYLRPVDVFMTPEGRQPNIGWIDASVLP